MEIRMHLGATGHSGKSENIFKKYCTFIGKLVTMDNFKLIEGLEFFIGKVKALPVRTKFNMSMYNTCVIGQTVGKDDPWNKHSAPDVALKYFGVIGRPGYNDCIFSDLGHFSVEPEEWEVIRLFTQDIGYMITRERWLKIAEPLLKSLKVQQGIPLSDLEEPNIFKKCLKSVVQFLEKWL